MDEIATQKLFSSVHPSDLLERIIADGVTQERFENVYRISDSGQCNRDACLLEFSIAECGNVLI